jgi:hypothetical protein
LASLKKGLAQVEQEITKPNEANFIEKMKVSFLRLVFIYV